MKTSLFLFLLLTFSSFSFAQDATCPPISLEEKIPYEGATFNGPFFNVPRDNQDGVNSCYANVAKNLLVGLSGGKDVASFLDMALAYKKSAGEVDKEFFDWGYTCATLNEVSKNGYCPQKYSPIETGEGNPLAEGLIPAQTTQVFAQLDLLNRLKDFLDSKTTFENKQAFSESFLAKSKMMMEKLKANPNIKLPLPVARYSIPEEWVLKESYKKLQKAGAIKVSVDDFLKEHAELYKEFYPLYVKFIVDGKTADQIFWLYKRVMTPFITKYKLEKDLENYKMIFKEMTAEDFKDPNLKENVKASLDFLKQMTGNEKKSDEEMIFTCSTGLCENMKFLSSLQDFVDYLKMQGLDIGNLANNKGIKDTAELLQLAAAPACLNPANRIKINIPFSCDSGYQFIKNLKASPEAQSLKIKKMRAKVVQSLKKGLPVGNATKDHINTIVGTRFNKETKACEYSIRESQTGTSFWKAEKDIFKEIEELTIVTKS